MKKLGLYLLVVVLLAGCSKWDHFVENIPFLQKEDKKQDNTTPEKTDKENEHHDVTDSNQSDQQTTNEDNQNVDPLTLEAAFFNEIKEVDGRATIQNPTNILALVNKSYGLPADYIPNDLVRPKVSFSFGDQDIEKSYMRKEAAEALEQMFHEAAKQGMQLYAVSGYRSYQRQTVLLDAEISRVGKEKAIQAVAFPGNSEHQTGLAMDISSPAANLLLSDEYGETPDGKWLATNAHLYGYILRYPRGKENETQYKYEPWHFRYVGKKAATTIYENNWTLEEYFNMVKKI